MSSRQKLCTHTHTRATVPLPRCVIQYLAHQRQSSKNSDLCLYSDGESPHMHEPAQGSLDTERAVVHVQAHTQRGLRGRRKKGVV